MMISLQDRSNRAGLATQFVKCLRSKAIEGLLPGHLKTRENQGPRRDA